MSVCFYLVRHGQTKLNRSRRIQGVTNSPLTKKGVALAEELGHELAFVHFAAAYTSDLDRAKETAAIIIKQNKCPHPVIAADPGLREYDFGPFEGLTKRKMVPRAWKVIGLKKVIKALASAKHVSALTELAKLLNGKEEAETADQLNRRMELTLKSIAQQVESDHPTGGDQNVLVVTHGLLLANFLEHMGAKVPLFLLKNASVARIDYRGGGFLLVNEHGRKTK